MARTKNRFNAVQIPEAVTAGVPVKQRKSFRVALYARLSVELKSRPSESIANQLSILREFIRDKAEFAEYQEYVDSAVSGTSFDRPVFGQMMDDVREGKISCIIVKDMSRFGRDYIESSNYIETIFPFLGVRFISVSDHFDTEVEYNQNKALEIALKNLVNDMYAKDISKRVSVSRRLDMERGKFTGSNAPYGYKVDSGDALRKYVIDRDAAAVVRQIFELAADGVTLREIAKALQEYRLALPGDYLKTGNLYVEEGTEAKSWYPGTISNILKNQAYIGNMVQGKRRISLYDNEARHATDENDWIVVENTHEAIVDKELFNKVRAVMDKKVEESIFTSDRGKNLPIKEDIFAGILFCGNCGRRIPLASRILEKDGVLERQYFYSCRYNYDFGGKQCGCKAEDISDTTKYEDHFVPGFRDRLIAISKSGRSLQSEDVQNFLKAKERGIHVELFVRKNKDDKISKEFYYLGHMTASGKTKEFKMANTEKTAVEIEWILDVPVREDIYEYIVNS